MISYLHKNGISAKSNAKLFVGNDYDLAVEFHDKLVCANFNNLKNLRKKKKT